MMPEKALTPGTVIRGEKHTYKVVSLLRSDGQGYTYKTVVKVGTGSHVREVFMVVREHMMARCSYRGADGMTVETPDDIAPTVVACMKAFARASHERAKVTADSPWLIGVIEAFAANNTYYYVVEYLDGQTLREYVESHGGHLSVEETRRILSPIFDAVRTLHRHHVMHTDIHPGHIRLIRTGKELTPVLFSLYSTLHFSDDGLQEWVLPAMNCEEGYAPPEQYGAIDHFYPQTDVYALAATLVYALSGRSLPDSRTVTEDAIRDTLPPALPETLAQAIINALDPDVKQRTSSISNFREELREFFRNMYNETTRKTSADPNHYDSPGAFDSLGERVTLLARKVLAIFGR